MSGVPMSSRARQRIPVAPGVIAIWVIVTWTTTITGPLVWAQPPAPAPDAAPGTPGATAPATETPRSEGPAQGKWSRLIERLLFNPRERTARGFDAVARAQSAAPVDTELPATSPDSVEPDAAPSGTVSPGTVSPGTVSPGTVSPGIVTDADRAAQAIGPFDSAARLLGSDDRGAYNAGTARLLAERADAAQLFESILDTEDNKLASNAAFNLGHSHLDTGQLEGAVDAFKKSLRRDPSRADAKHNLEIALRRLREKQQEQKQQQEQQQQDQNQQNGEQEEQDQNQQDGEQGEQEEQQKDGEQGEQEEQDDQQKGDEQEQEQEQEQDGEPQEQPQEQPQDGEQGEQEESPLPQFEDQPDMTAEEAAAILEAVENLEREARRQEALEAARKQAKGKKDW